MTATDAHALEARTTSPRTPRTRIAANLLLTAMPLVLAASKAAEAAWPEHAWALGFATSASAAALAGGIADWFAVTALFRRPFGLPIPHTALVPNSKDRIAGAIGKFAADNFLSEEVLAPRLRLLRPSKAVGAWLSSGENAAKASEAVLDAMLPLLQSGGFDGIRGLVVGAVREELLRADASPVAAGLLKAFIDGGHHRALYDRALDLAEHLLREHKAEIGEKVSSRSSWWVPKKVDAALGEQVGKGIEDLLFELRSDAHPARKAFEDKLRTLRRQIQEDPRMRARIAGIKAKALSGSGLDGFAGEAWRGLRAKAAADAADPQGGLRGAVEGALAEAGRRLSEEPEAREAFDGWVRTMAGDVLKEYGAGAAGAVADVVRRWDAETLSRKIEAQVGDDLQFVRINGTVVGGLVGLALHLLGA